MRHYLVTDNSVAWFTKIVSTDETQTSEPIEMIDIPKDLGGAFLDNIFNRELHFENKSFSNETYSGWTISKYEFDRIKRLCELVPQVQEYHKLLKI